MNITAARTRGESRPNIPRVEKAASTRWLREWVIGRLLKNLCVARGRRGFRSSGPPVWAVHGVIRYARIVFRSNYILLINITFSQCNTRTAAPAPLRSAPGRGMKAVGRVGVAEVLGWR